MEQVITGSHVSLTLHGRIDITGGSAVMQYRKPGASADAELTVDVLDPPQASCQALLTPAIHDAPGIWRAWVKTTTAGEQVGYGKTYRFRSVRPGN